MSTDDELRICARRVLIAWDGTVLPKHRDEQMFERMEDLRSSLEAQPQPEPVAWMLEAPWGKGVTLDKPDFGLATWKAPVPTLTPLYAHPPAQPEPVAWIQPDHLQKARVAPFLCRVEPTKRMSDFIPIYTEQVTHGLQMECPASATDDSGSADGVGAWCVDAAVMEHAARPLKPAPQSEPVALTDDVLKRLWCECKSIDNWEFCVEYGRGVLAAQAGKGNT